RRDRDRRRERNHRRHLVLALRARVLRRARRARPLPPRRAALAQAAHSRDALSGAATVIAVPASRYPAPVETGGRAVFRRGALRAAVGCICLLTGQVAAAASVDLAARRDDGSLIHWSLD